MDINPSFIGAHRSNYKNEFSVINLTKSEDISKNKETDSKIKNFIKNSIFYHLLGSAVKPIKNFVISQALGTKNAKTEETIDNQNLYKKDTDIISPQEAREVRRQDLIKEGGKVIRFSQGDLILDGMFFEATSTTLNPIKQKTILLCTGSQLPYEEYAAPLIKELKKLGHHVMVFNYEGFGKSEGKISKEGIYKSTEAAYQYLKQHKKCEDKSIVAWGYSLGSAAVSNLVSHHPYINVVVDRGFTSMSKVAESHAIFGLKTITKVITRAFVHFDNLTKLDQAKGNVLIVQANNDEIMHPKVHEKQLKNLVETDSINRSYMTVEAKHLHETGQIHKFAGEKGELFIKADNLENPHDDLWFAEEIKKLNPELSEIDQEKIRKIQRENLKKFLDQ